MKNNYTMILWSENYDDSFKQQVNRVYQSLLVMSSIKKLKPRFLTASSKEKATNFELVKSNVEDLILKNMDELHSDLGARFSFFTSKDDTDMCGIQMSACIKNPLFPNNIAISINAIDFFGKQETRDEIIAMFKKLIEINSPFYACVTDDENYKLFNGYYDKNKHTPKSLYWLNYLGSEAINTLRNKRIKIEDISHSVFALEKQNNGYFIQLSETPIIDDERKLALQKEVNQQLGL